MPLLAHIYMIDWHKLNQLISKYAQDENLASAKERYDECMQDPDCAAKYRMDAAERQRKYLERQKAMPADTFKARQQIKSDVVKALRESGSIEGLAHTLGVQIATLKSELRKKLVRSGLDPITHKGFLEFQKDAGEMYYLREKLQEFAKDLKFKEPGAPLSPNSADDLIEIKNILHSFIQKFGLKYKSITATMYKIQSKLNEL